MTYKRDKRVGGWAPCSQLTEESEWRDHFYGCKQCVTTRWFFLHEKLFISYEETVVSHYARISNISGIGLNQQSSGTLRMSRFVTRIDFQHFSLLYEPLQILYVTKKCPMLKALICKGTPLSLGYEDSASLMMIFSTRVHPILLRSANFFNLDS